MSVLRRAKLRTPDGTESIEYPLGVDAENVEVANRENLSQRLVRIDEDLEENKEDIAAVNELAGRNRQNIGANEIRINALERRSISAENVEVANRENLSQRLVRIDEDIVAVSEIAGTNRQNIGAAEVRIDALERRGMSIEQKPYYFDTVANMKADTKLKIRDIVITLGYYEANDGGKAKYYITENIDNIITNDGFHILLDNGLVANLLIENSVVNIKSLGAKSYDGQNKTDIATYINYYMDNVKSSIVTLFIPAGLWYCSGFTFNHSFSLKGVKDCTTNSVVRGTYITSLNDNQDYIFKIGGERGVFSSFNLEDISFTTCEGSYLPDLGIIYYMRILLDSYTKRINDACLKFINVNSGVVKNINFYGIIGKAMTMCSSWEIIFDDINFQSISNIDNYIVSFETMAEPVNYDYNFITNCVFKYIHFKEIHGALFEVQQNAFLIGNNFYCISFEDSMLVNIANITDENYVNNFYDFNDNTAIHQPLFDLKGNCGGNTIHSLVFTNLASYYLKYNNNKYVHDTIFKFSNSNFTADFIVNAINTFSFGKDIKIILSKNNTLKNCQMYFGKISHKHNGNNNFYFDVENFPYIESENTLNRYDTTGVVCENVTSFVDCFINGGFGTSSRGLICFDNQARSKSKLCIKPEIPSENSGDRIFALFLQKSKKLYIRAKVENGVTANPTLLLEDNSGYQNLAMIGTGQFKTYEFDVTFDIGSILKIVTSSSSTNTGLYDCFWFG